MPCGQRRSVITPMAVCRGHAEHTETLPAPVTGAICQQSQVALRFRWCNLHRIRPRPPLSSSPDRSPADTLHRLTTTTKKSTMRATRPLEQLLKYTLTSPSPLIRIRGSPKAPPTLAEDFAIYPSFFNEAECRQLLSIALWKLDRLDVTRKRGSRRRSASSAPAAAAATEDGAPLQDMFTGTYGFEEVSCRTAGYG